MPEIPILLPELWRTAYRTPSLSGQIEASPSHFDGLEVFSYSFFFLISQLIRFNFQFLMEILLTMYECVYDDAFN